MTAIAAARILLPGGHWGGPGTVTVAGGRIAAVADTPGPATGTLTPGLLDLHNNGAFGVDFIVSSVRNWRPVLTKLAQRGVTAVQPTVITAPLPVLVATLRRAAGIRKALDGEPLARVLGMHVEGPFLSPEYRGAHRLDWLRDPTADAVDALLTAGAGFLRTVTLAPERPGALDAIRRLVDAGITVSLGHSDADAGTAAAAADAGATCVTHLFNAMRPFHHRDPGLVGAALTDGRFRVGLIPDGQHVDSLACRLAFAAAPGRIVAVTDSILIAGLPPGTTLQFGGLPVAVDETGLGRRPDGTISGAGVVGDEGVRRLIRMGIDPAIVLCAATETPADAVGRPDLGRIAPGAAADLVWWDDEWVPRRVWIAGQEIAA